MHGLRHGHAAPPTRLRAAWVVLGCLALHRALNGTGALGAPPAQLSPGRPQVRVPPLVL